MVLRVAEIKIKLFRHFTAFYIKKLCKRTCAPVREYLCIIPFHFITRTRVSGMKKCHEDEK